MGKGGAMGDVGDVENLRRSLRSVVDQLCDQTASKAPAALVETTLASGVAKLRAELRTEISETVEPLAARLEAAEARLEQSVSFADVKRMLAESTAQMDESLRGVRSDCEAAVLRVAEMDARLGACEAALREHEEIIPQVPEHGARLVQAEAGLGAQAAQGQEVMQSMSALQAKVDAGEKRLEGVESALEEMGASLVDVKSRETELNAELARTAALAAAPAPTPAPAAAAAPAVAAAPAPAPTIALPADLEEKLAKVDSLEQKLSLLGNLSSEIDQIHTTQRETRHELVLLKRDEGSLSNSLADTKQHLGRAQSVLDQLSDTIASDVSPFTSRLRSLPTSLEQIERKLQAMGEWQEGERQSLVAQLNTKADKSAVAPVQKALVMIRDMLFDAGHRKCSAGRAQVGAACLPHLPRMRCLSLSLSLSLCTEMHSLCLSQFRCLTCDKLQSELEGSLGHVATGRLAARQTSPAAETIFKYGPVNRTARRAESVREASIQSPRPPGVGPSDPGQRRINRPGTAPAR